MTTVPPLNCIAGVIKDVSDGSGIQCRRLLPGWEQIPDCERTTGYAEVIPVNPTATLLPACRPTIHDARQGCKLSHPALRLSFGDGVQPIHDSGLHCDPMVRKRMVGAHVLLGNLGIASLPQGFC